MSPVIYISLFNIGNLIMILIAEFYARMVFIARGYCRRYGHGKSFNRAHRHYKKNWTFWQRLLWIPVFREDYEARHRAHAWLSYIHWGITLLAFVTFFFMGEKTFPWWQDWRVWVILVWVHFFEGRIVYTEYVARGK